MDRPLTDIWEISTRVKGGDWGRWFPADEIRVNRGDGYDIIRLDKLIDAVIQALEPTEDSND